MGTLTKFQYKSGGFDERNHFINGVGLYLPYVFLGPDNKVVFDVVKATGSTIVNLNGILTGPYTASTLGFISVGEGKAIREFYGYGPAVDISANVGFDVLIGNGDFTPEFTGSTFNLIRPSPNNDVFGFADPERKGQSYLSGAYSITYTYDLPVSPLAPAVPEPSSWMMLISGFGLIGASLRQRRYLQRS